MSGPSQLLDPRWHWLRQALGKLYAEVEPGNTFLALTITEADEGGIVTTYTAMPHLDEVQKRVITDPEAIVQGYDNGTISANFPITER